MEQPEDHIHQFGNNESRTFLTKNEHDRFVSEGKEEGNENVVKGKSNEY